jgi:putative phosphoesterase
MITLNKHELKMGIISDTHGLFRKQIDQYFKGVDCILHAGDIGSPEVIEKLTAIAPVYAVLGNTDPPFIFTQYNYEETVETPDHKIYIAHNFSDIEFDVKNAGYNIVVSGHTHKPLIKTESDILYVNPGSAGPLRSNLPISMALLNINGNSLQTELIGLDYM